MLWCRSRAYGRGLHDEVVVPCPGGLHDEVVVPCSGGLHDEVVVPRPARTLRSVDVLSCDRGSSSLMATGHLLTVLKKASDRMLSRARSGRHSGLDRHTEDSIQKGRKRLQQVRDTAGARRRNVAITWTTRR